MLSSQSFITSLFYLQLSRYRQNRWSSRRIRKRVVLKNGECNVVQSNVAKRRRRYLADIFTTMVRHHLLLKNKQKCPTKIRKKRNVLFNQGMILQFILGRHPVALDASHLYSQLCIELDGLRRPMVAHCFHSWRPRTRAPSR